MLDKFLKPILDKIPGGFKTLTGLSAMLVIQVLLLLGKIDQATADQYYDYAVLLTGVGLYHKATENAAKGKE